MLEKSKDKKSWGLFCAALGSQKNKRDFLFRVLNRGYIEENILYNKDYLDKTNLAKDEKGNLIKNKNGKPFIKDEKGNLKEIEDGKYLHISIIDYLTSNPENDFESAKKEFNQALEYVENLQKEILKEQQEFENLSHKIKSYEERYSYFKPRYTEEEIKTLYKSQSQTNIELKQIKEKIENITANLQELRTDRQFLQDTKPSIFTEIFYRIFFPKKYHQLKNNTALISTKTDEIETYNRELKQHKSKKASLEENLISIDKSFRVYQEDITQKEKYRQEYLKAQQKLESLKQFDFFAQDEVNREKSSPLMKEDGKLTEFFDARVKLFLCALNLHKQAILANAAKLAANYKMLRRNFNGESFDSKDMVEVWRTLFFQIPVISSTFASFSNCFKDFGENGLVGYLLIDEAGQAALPNAVGALLRSRHVIVVGDPLQLEPVVTLPPEINKSLLEEYGITDEFNLANTSIQMRADKIEQNGTYLGKKENALWVGSPLRVHKRCDNPMFKISNETTYDNLMIWGKDKNNGNKKIKSCWIDVKTKTWNGNASTEEIDALYALLQHDELKNEEGKNIAIISPFRDCVKAVRERLNQENSKRKQAKLPDYTVGTIHTMQGKEAPIVIFILGGSSDGAKNWAASKPNLLNVAVTRAKNYLFIIGDKEKWEKLSYFDQAAGLLAHCERQTPDNPAALSAPCPPDR